MRTFSALVLMAVGVQAVSAAHVYHGHHTHHGHSHHHHVDYRVESSLRAQLLRLPTGDLDSDIVDDGDTIASASGDYESHSRLAVTYHARWSQRDVAFALGAGLAFSGGTFDIAGVETDVSEFGVLIEPGISIRTGDHFDVEIGWQFGFGASDAERGGDNYDGAYFDTALIVRPVYTFGGGAQVFADLGYMTRYQVFDLAVTDLEQEIQVDGFIFGLGGGYRF